MTLVSDQYIGMMGNTGCVATTSNTAVLSWQSDGSLTLQGPVQILQSSSPIPDTTNVQLVQGSPTTISSSLTCNGDIVTMGGGVFVLSDQRTKEHVTYRDPNHDLSKICDLAAVNFNHHACSHQRVGLLANMVHSHIPQAVCQTQSAAKDIMANVTLKSVGSGLYTMESGPYYGLIDVWVNGLAKVAKANGFILQGDLGKGGVAFMTGHHLPDCLCIDYQTLTAVQINATRALSLQIKMLSEAVDVLMNSRT